MAVGAAALLAIGGVANNEGATNTIANTIESTSNISQEIVGNIKDFLNHEVKFSVGNKTITVRSGDTLWTLADQVKITGDVNKLEIIDEIKDRNPGVEKSLQAGSAIELPLEAKG